MHVVGWDGGTDNRGSGGGDVGSGGTVSLIYLAAAPFDCN